MSVQKFTSVTTQAIPYTQINNQVADNIGNLEAFGVWVYLSTKPGDWKVVREQLKARWNIGEQKIKSIFSYLKQCNLIKYVQIKDDCGKFVQWEIVVLNGSEFVNNQHVDKKESTGSISIRMEPHPNGKQGLQKKDKEQMNNKEQRKQESTPRKSKVTYSFTPTDKHRDMAMQSGLDMESEREMFIDYYTARGQLMLDWNACFSNWLRKAATYKKSKGLFGPRKETGSERAIRMCLS